MRPRGSRVKRLDELFQGGQVLHIVLTLSRLRASQAQTSNLELFWSTESTDCNHVPVPLLVDGFSNFISIPSFYEQ